MDGIRDQLLVEDANDSGTKVNLVRSISQDITDIVAGNQALRQGDYVPGIGDNLFEKPDNMTLRARIPLVFIEDWKVKYAWDFLKANMNLEENKAMLAMLLNKDEYRIANTYGENF